MPPLLEHAGSHEQHYKLQPNIPKPRIRATSYIQEQCLGKDQGETQGAQHTKFTGISILYLICVVAESWGRWHWSWTGSRSLYLDRNADVCWEREPGQWQLACWEKWASRQCLCQLGRTWRCWTLASVVPIFQRIRNELLAVNKCSFDDRLETWPTFAALQILPGSLVWFIHACQTI